MGFWLRWLTANLVQGWRNVWGVATTKMRIFCAPGVWMFSLWSLCCESFRKRWHLIETLREGLKERRTSSRRSSRKPCKHPSSVLVVPHTWKKWGEGIQRRTARSFQRCSHAKTSQAKRQKAQYPHSPTLRLGKGWRECCGKGCLPLALKQAKSLTLWRLERKVVLEVQVYMSAIVKTNSLTHSDSMQSKRV